MNLEFLDALLRRYTASRILVVGTFVCISLWIVYRFGFGGSEAIEVTPLAAASPQTEQAPNQPRTEPSTALFADEPGTPSDSPVVQSRPRMDPEELERRINKASNIEIKRLIDQAGESIDEWKKARDEWNRVIVDVGDGDTGRALASDKKSIPRLVELIELGQERADEFSDLRSQVEKISAQVDEFLGVSGEGEVTEKTRTTIEGLRALVERKSIDQIAALDELRERVEKAEGNALADATLNEVIAESRRAEERKAIDKAISVREQVRRENEERLLEAERMKAEAEIELEEAKLAAERERVKAATEQEQAEINRMKLEEEAKLADVRLRADFARDLQEINTLLSPFVSQDEHTLYPPNNHLYSGQKTGVSLSAIAKWGALEPGDDGVDAMAQLGQTKYRPLGSFPKYVQSEWKRNPAVKKRLERAQELLRKYGELLVEKGMLEK